MNDVELTITGLTSSGDGVARLADGRVVFVRGGLPGDLVEARATREQPRMVNADVVRVLRPSPHRVSSVCQRVGCGGCALRDFAPEAQREAKADQVLQAITRIAKLDAKPVFTGMVSGEPWGYRHRARFHARHDGEWRIGYHGRASHELVPLTQCPVLWPELERAALELAAWLAKQPRSLGLREVELAYSRRDGRATAFFIGDGAASSAAAINTPFAHAPFADAPFANAPLHYDHAGDFSLLFSAGVFTQANPAMNEKLVAAVTANVQGKRVLELHSGIGNFSLPLARAGCSVKAVEQNPASSALAKINAQGFDVTPVNADDASAVADADSYDTVLLDPPRIGAKEVASKLAHRGPPRIVYVSCDPATLARDLRLLADGGYRLESLASYDMFPQTPHVESLAVLTR